MESFEDSVRRLVVTDSVRIFRSGLVGTAGLAIFHAGGDRWPLPAAVPLVRRGENGENQVSGDSVLMTMRGGKADRVR